ncbi:MAG: IPT/TIG domain-containing protein, partial [Chitinophagales bacterium]
GGNSVSGFSIDNFDGDGKPDLAADIGLESIFMLQNTSTPGLINFNLGVTIPNFDNRAIAGDFDNDGKVDLAFNAGAARVTIWRNQTTQSQLLSISPTSGKDGDTIVLSGYNLSGVTNVSFGGIGARKIIIVDASTIKAVIDTGATGDVVVGGSSGTSTVSGFVYTPRPKIISFNPTSAALGSTIIISGKNFSGTSAVTFGGVPAISFTLVNPDTITAMVGYGNSGSVAVTATYGSDSLAGFTYVIPKVPVITSVTPSSGPVGATITISGHDFNPDTALNYVYFGPAKAKLVSATANTLVVLVPHGAAYGNVSVTSNSLTGFSPKSFIPTFSGGGDISLGSFSEVSTYQTYASPEGVCIADFDLDGKNDLGVTSSGYAGIEIMRNTSDTVNISFDPIIGIPGVYPSRIITSTDMDGDGLKDAIAGGDYSGILSVYRNVSHPGSINFTDRLDYNMQGLASPVNVITTGDIDGDGKPDLILVGYNHVSIVRNLSYPGKILLGIMNTMYLADMLKSVKLGDVDGDGKLDILLVSGSTDSVFILRNTSSNGSFSFDPPVRLSDLVPNFTVSGSNDLCINDLDGDGRPEIAVTHIDPSYSISILKNNSTPGNLSFQLEKNLSIAPAAPFTMGVEDLDGDGKPDLVFNSDGYGRYVSTIKNNSSPDSLSFAQNILFYFDGGLNPASFCTGDINNDGRPEIITTSGVFTSPGDLYIFKNQTNGPHITSFTPNNGIVDSVVTIQGSNFTGATAVSFGDSVAKSFTVVSPTRINAVLSGGMTGNVTVATPLGSTSISGFSYGLPPTIKSFSPSNGPINTYITIKGTHFTWVTDVKFGGVSAAFLVPQSDTELLAVVNFGASGNVTVYGGGDSASLPGFSFVPPPVIDSFSPDSAITGTIVTILGSNLENATDVLFGNTPAQSFTVVDSSRITAVVGAGSTGVITVSTPGGTTNDYNSTFYYFAPPVITSFTPDSAGPDMAVTISGQNFSAVSAVSFGGIPAASFTVNDPTSITAIIARGGSGIVSVVTPGGTASDSGFTFIPGPTIVSFVPANAGSGDTVTITGTNLAGATAVTFGGTSASSYTVVDSTKIIAKIGAGASGSVSVTTPGGTAKSAGFTFDIVNITSFTPTSTGKGNSVTIRGANFNAATAVSFGGKAASSFTIVDSTTIVAIVGIGASGNVVVTTPIGTDSLSGFIFILPPTITSFTPTKAGKGDTVTIIGTNLTGATIVAFGGTSALSYTIVDSTIIIAKIGAGFSGNVVVVTPGGTAYLSGFTFNIVTDVGNVTPNSNELKVYPNPANDYLLVEHPISSKAAYIKWIDMSGRVIKITSIGRNVTKTVINTKDLLPGIYEIIWNDGTKSLGKTVLISK